MSGWRDWEGLIRAAGLVVGLPLLAALLAFGRTAGQRRTLREQAARIESARATEDQAPTQAPARTAPDIGIRDGRLLHAIGAERFGVSAERYTPILVRAEGTTELWVGELVLSGGFIPMTRLLKEIEAEHRGAVVSVAYRLVEEPPARQKKLEMTLIVQQLTRDEE